MNIRIAQKVEVNLPILILVLGLLVWVYVPIVGIFPLLLFVHLNKSYGNKKIEHLIKNIILLIVLFTVTVFCCSIEIYLDTAVYVNEYKRCAGDYFVECIEQTSETFEPAFYFLSSLFFILSRGSERGFLFLWSFTINFLTIFIICKGFSKKYHALLVMLTLGNPAFYMQTFLMRQFMAVSMFLCAIVTRRNKLLSCFYFIVSALNHYTSLIYLPFFLAALISGKNESQSKKVSNNYWRNYLLLMVLLIFLGITSSANKTLFGTILAALDSTSIFSTAAQKGAFFLKNDNQGGLNGHSVLITIISTVYIYIAIQLYKQRNLKSLRLNERENFDKIVTSLYSAQVFFFLVSRGIDDQFALRLSLLLITYVGLFLYLPLEKHLLLGKLPSLSLLIVVCSFMTLFFGNFLYSISIGNNAFNFFEGEPFISLTGYIDYIGINW